MKLTSKLVLQFLLFALVLSLGTFAILGVYEARTVASSTQPLAAVEAQAVAPSSALAGQRVEYLATKGEGSRVFLKSSDGGATWERLPLGLPLNANGQRMEVTAMVVAPHDSSILYVGTNGKGAFRISENGTSVEALGMELRGTLVTKLEVDRVNPSLIRAWTDRGLYLSTDNGESWQLQQEEAIAQTAN
jgi:photosystem II stability/assembly factor-like uncharacterized protein